MLEIHPVYGNNQIWEMVLRKDPIQWYEKCRKRCTKCKASANNYIKQVTNEHKDSDPKRSIQPQENKDLYKLHVCQQTISTDKNKCLFYVCKDYCIRETKNYFAAARTNKTPVITISPRIHLSNEKWVELIQICQHRRTSVEIL